MVSNTFQNGLQAMDNKNCQRFDHLESHVQSMAMHLALLYSTRGPSNPGMIMHMESAGQVSRIAPENMLRVAPKPLSPLQAERRYVHNSQKINYSKGQRNGLVRKYRPAVLVVINVKGVVLKFWRVSAISTYHVNIYMVWCDSNGLLVPSKIIIFHPYGEE
jgi:hypothetical protein